MNRAEYMKELAYLLQDMPDDEREEALQYYEDYFDDAGAENEGQVISELGRPEKIAAIIREGVQNGYGNQDAEYTESGYRNERYRGPQYEVVPPESTRKDRIDEKKSGNTEGGWNKNYSDERAAEDDWKDASYHTAYDYEDMQTEQKEDRTRRRRRNPLLWILLAFAALFAIPMLAGGAAVAFGGAVTVVCAVGGVALAVVLVAVVLLVAGVIILGIGIAKLFVFPVAGLMFSGVGLILFAVGMLFTWLAVLICGKMIPGIVHMIGNFFNFLSRKLRRGGAAA